jgi:RNA polymerase sigma-70 factor, ECF subfamily
MLALVYDEFRAIAADHLRRERGRGAGGAGHTLQPTAIVHEAYLRMMNLNAIDWRDPVRFRMIASGVIRRVLVDHARARAALKRGGRGGRGGRITLNEANTPIVEADIDVLALDEAMHKLHRLAERKCRVVELRFFGGLTIDETARALGVGTTTVEDDWAFARAWLRRELEG